uniref:Uncharacterized protein n=1 Tax=Candidatus Kentrum sp. SD TaxID=2126332 RepID=A0A450YQY8_9GAMM|nr:MAG: hypothetical protein BECKSD772F_GA0070984_11625 [Candidatus Kentron sp. SD]VFK49231.1 MAG: hypothetical protein BECKSD772E_GA0070983_11663 [Candidatus Kentron sp. SD]VFK79956.1 MAG: hypothetical protein BECKSD772D_GA0070982_10767 [Candidatus Kentron sp. SD]
MPCPNISRAFTDRFPNPLIRKGRHFQADAVSRRRFPGAGFPRYRLDGDPGGKRKPFSLGEMMVPSRAKNAPCLFSSKPCLYPLLQERPQFFLCALSGPDLRPLGVSVIRDEIRFIRECWALSQASKTIHQR